MNDIHSALTRLPTRLFHQGEGQCLPCVFISMKQRVCFSFHVIQERFSRWIKPSTTLLLLRTFVEVVSTSWFLRWWVFLTRVLLSLPKWPLRFRAAGPSSAILIT